ncbi:ABC transporter ATP-binding protein/permease [Thiocapsa roseopersicina]|uniref:Putative ATP-binding cassette transporter n=1 Tax=Thiocapsa roseopersicina TaxID=1058 RepID=A0A1H2WVJ6_THIRO|nr:ABC transporter transmembrane domain-containing protein [Thiocapsa roseopersicina]SDW84585.1 putative ATP-binding cassette transporter [Thiocapsa roseopersicina]
MIALRTTISRTTWKRFLEMLAMLARSEVGGKAKLLFALLILLLFGMNGLNVLNSYVGRDFMTAIENKDMGGFSHFALLYVGVFALSTLVAVYFRYSEERLGLVWRTWLTGRAVERYLDNRTYFRLQDTGDLANPDQRISEDIRYLTATTLSFVLLLLNASFTVIAFSGVMWSISPLLFVVAVSYAALGSFMTVLLGKPLIRLNYDQLDKEANFRSRLIHVRENADSIALLRREARLKYQLLERLADLTTNFQRIILVNRNLGFFTTGYNYMIQIIPALVVAPLFIKGDAQFGVIAQSAIAFAHLLGAFSLIVTQFQSISAYTAVIARLAGLREAMGEDQPPGAPNIEICNDCDRVAFDALTLRSPRSGRDLVNALSASVPRGKRLLIIAPNESAKTALFRATAGLWDAGEGRILRPNDRALMFLPERPYLPPGTLRQLVTPSDSNGSFTDERILATLRALKLEPALVRAGGLDTERNWNELLSLGEQQLLAFARVILAEPAFVMLDHPTRALSECQIDELLAMLRERGMTYITLGDEDDDPAAYDEVLSVAQDGTWSSQT